MIKKHYLQFLSDNRFKILFFSLLLLLFVPAFSDEKHFDIIDTIIVSVFLFACINFVRDKKRIIVFSIVLVVLILLSRWINISLKSGVSFYNIDKELTIFYAFSSLLFFFIIERYLLSSLMDIETINADAIFASISGYLLLGIIASDAFHLIEILNNGSFAYGDGMAISTDNFLYFSFVTLLTIGFGDIIPVSNIAQSFTIFFGIIGYLYITILIAIIIGKYISNEMKKN